jgi:DNA-binding transcriptional LysR family regulator
LFESIEAFRHQSNGVAGRLIGEVRKACPKPWINRCCNGWPTLSGVSVNETNPVRIELISAMPGEMERLLLQQRLDLAIGYFSQVQSAFDYRELFSETQHLYCAPGHPLFDNDAPDDQALQPATGSIIPASCAATNRSRKNCVRRARNRSKAPSPSSCPASMSGICPATSPEAGKTKALLRVVRREGMSFDVAFHLARHRALVPGDAQKAFEEDLLAAFA